GPRRPRPTTPSTPSPSPRPTPAGGASRTPLPAPRGPARGPRRAPAAGHRTPGPSAPSPLSSRAPDRLGNHLLAAGQRPDLVRTVAVVNPAGKVADDRFA